jgi:hypothetical protein
LEIGSTLAGFLNRYVHFCTDGQISQRFNVGISAPTILLTDRPAGSWAFRCIPLPTAG